MPHAVDLLGRHGVGYRAPGVLKRCVTAARVAGRIHRRREESPRFRHRLSRSSKKWRRTRSWHLALLMQHRCSSWPVCEITDRRSRFWSSFCRSFRRQCSPRNGGIVRVLVEKPIATARFRSRSAAASMTTAPARNSGSRSRGLICFRILTRPSRCSLLQLMGCSPPLLLDTSMYPHRAVLRICRSFSPRSGSNPRRQQPT